MSEKHCLYLSKNPIRFEPVSSATSVFFDESNEQLIIARSNGAGGVVVKSARDKTFLNLRLDDKGELRSLNFSPNSRILAMHRTASKSVDFISVAPGWEAKEFSQQCKAKGGKIVGVFWCADTEVVFVTDKGIEHYQVNPERRSLKLLKSLNQEINWFFWMADGSVCGISTGPQCNIFYVLLFKDGAFARMPKFEIDLPGQSQVLRQKDMLLIKLYDQTYACHIVAPSEVTPVEIHLYLIKKDSLTKITDILLMDVVSRVVVNVVDNLLVVHHQITKTSFLFDILLDGVETRGGVKFHKPLISSLPIRPFKLTLSAVPTASGVEMEEVNCELYSSSWAVFGPDIVLDARLGCYWNVRLDLETLVNIVTDKSYLIDILMNRKGSKLLVLKVCYDLICGNKDTPQVDLDTIGKVFDRFNKNLNGRYNTEGLSQAYSFHERHRNHHHHHLPHRIIVEQSDVYQHILCKLEEDQAVKEKFMNAVITQYLLSLSNHHIPTQTFISEFLVNRLIHQQDFNRLLQYLQYHVVEDSKAIAFKLLSVEDKFPAGYQLAVDMLKRLATCNESILEIFLSKNLLFTAIRFAHANGMLNHLPPQRLLDVAMTSGDDLLYYSIYNFFRFKNLKQRGNYQFFPGERHAHYLEYYNKKFPSVSPD